MQVFCIGDDGDSDGDGDGDGNVFVVSENNRKNNWELFILAHILR